MSEPFLRIALIVGVIALSLVVVWLGRVRSSRRPRPVVSTGLDEGLYLFTSSSCAECASARAVLEEAVGDGYSEVDWETHPELFERLRIGAVPTTLLVGADGSALAFSGDPTRALGSFGP